MSSVIGPDVFVVVLVVGERHRRQGELVRGGMGRHRRRGRGRRGEGIEVCIGEGTVLCRVPYITAAGVGEEVTKGELPHGVDELVGDTLTVAARAWTNSTDGSLSGVNNFHKRCAAKDMSEKVAPRVLCMQGVWRRGSPNQ